MSFFCEHFLLLFYPPSFVRCFSRFFCHIFWLPISMLSVGQYLLSLQDLKFALNRCDWRGVALVGRRPNEHDALDRTCWTCCGCVYLCWNRKHTKKWSTSNAQCLSTPGPRKTQQVHTGKISKIIHYNLLQCQWVCVVGSLQIVHYHTIMAPTTDYHSAAKDACKDG